MIRVKTKAELRLGGRTFSVIKTEPITRNVMRIAKNSIVKSVDPRYSMSGSFTVNAEEIERVFGIKSKAPKPAPRIEVALCPSCGQHVFATVGERKPEFFKHDAPCGLPCRCKRGRRDTGKLAEGWHTHGSNGHTNNGKCRA